MAVLLKDVRMETRGLQELWRRLLPPEVSVCAGTVSEFAHTELADAEAQAVAGAVEKRRREFSAGRAVARRALCEAGIGEYPIRMNPDRSPAWPAGVVGSITHTNHACAAAVARQDRVTSLGLDMEDVDRLKEPLWRVVFSAAEQEWLRQQDAAAQLSYAALLFSAKESFYKYQHPMTSSWVGCLDAQVHVLPDQEQFELVLNRADVSGLPAGTTFRGRYGFVDGLVCTAVAGPPQH